MAKEGNNHTILWVAGAIGAYLLYRWWLSQQPQSPAGALSLPARPLTEGTVIVPGGVVPASSINQNVPANQLTTGYSGDVTGDRTLMVNYTAAMAGIKRPIGYSW